MNGLRVYIRAVMAQPEGEISAFYTRKGGGPFYQWQFDDKLGVWHCSRVNSSDLTSRSFNLARWKSLPDSLRVRLSEHYIE
ncbi:MAG TPA: hypothetical protein VI306_10945 [Pyrinomonadaceae bacterium]